MSFETLIAEAVLHCGMQETSGVVAVNEHGGDGAYVGMDLATASGPGPGNYYPLAIQFNGVNDYVNVPSEPTLVFGDQPFTVACWVKFDSFTGSSAWPAILGKGGTASGEWMVRANSSGIVGFYTEQGGWQAQLSVLPAGVWVFLAYDFDGTNLRSYKDGVLQSMSAFSANLTTTKSLRFGNADGAWQRFLDGEMSGVVVFTRSLSAVEHVELFENAFGEPPQVLTATVDGTSISLDYDIDLKVATNYAINTWTFADNGTAISVVGAVQTGVRTVQLTLARAPTSQRLMLTFDNSSYVQGAVVPRGAGRQPALSESLSVVSLVSGTPREVLRVVDTLRTVSV